MLENMKKLIIILVTVGTAFMSQSCSDYLTKDANVDTTLSYQQIFSDVHYAPGFLDNIYKTSNLIGTCNNFLPHTDNHRQNSY